jgi:hypothetical protein
MTDAIARLEAAGLRFLPPAAETETLFPFLADSDYYIVAKACVVIGRRRWEPGVDRLADVALHGVSNGRTAAIGALGRIGTVAALQALVRVHETLPVLEVRGDWHLFARAFADCGCEVDTSVRLKPRYRTADGAAWKPLRR